MGKQRMNLNATASLGRGTVGDWTTNGYIDASSVFGGVTAKYWVDGVVVVTPSALIDRIAEISSSSTKTTEIVTSWTGNTQPKISGGDVATYGASMNIFIDWENEIVKWTDSYDQVGSASISLVMGSTTPLGTMAYTWGRASRDSSRLVHRTPMVLRTGTNRNILGLPAMLYAGDGSDFSGLGFNAPFNGSYTITTDDGINVTAAPTPPAETPTVAPVVGVKISELNAVDALQDDDLFVLSQDNASDGTYNASYNVTLAKLGQSIGIAAGGWSSGWSAAKGDNTSAPYSHTLNSTDVVWQIYVAEDAEGLNAIAMDVQFDLLVAYNDSYGAMLRNVTGTSFELILGAGYFDALYGSGHVGKSFDGKFVKVVGRRS